MVCFATELNPHVCVKPHSVVSMNDNFEVGTSSRIKGQQELLNALKQREIIAERLRALMRSRPDLDTQVKLARRAGVSQSTVGRTLSCETSPSADSLLDIARALGTTPAALLLEDDLEVKILEGIRVLSPDARQRLLGFISGLQSEPVSQKKHFSFDSSSSVPSFRVAAHAKAAARPLNAKHDGQSENAKTKPRSRKS